MWLRKQRYTSSCHCISLRWRLCESEKTVCDKTTEIMEASIYEAGQRERDKERCSGTESGRGRTNRNRKKNRAVIPNELGWMTGTKLAVGGVKRRKMEFCRERERACSAIWIHSPGLEKTEGTLHQHLDCRQYRWVIIVLFCSTAGFKKETESLPNHHPDYFMSAVSLSVSSRASFTMRENPNTHFLKPLSDWIRNCWWSSPL